MEVKKIALKRERKGWKRKEDEKKGNKK